MTNVGVASSRYRVTFTGPGGHSYGAFGAASPIHALGRAISAVARLEVLRTPRTTFNVGRVGGGVSVNAIAPDAWMEVDLRSEDHQALEALVADVHRVVDQALAKENRARSQQGALTVEKALIGERPVGRTPSDSPIVVAAVSVTRALNLPVTLSEGSTDANLPMSLGIPAITIEGGGRVTGAHSTRETFDTTIAWQGTQRATLLAIALTQP
jgi:di/tripeptidase